MSEPKMPPPLSQHERVLRALAILIAAVAEMVEDPDTEMSLERADALSAELRVADALLGRKAARR